jgi:hypothetical protein
MKRVLNRNGFDNASRSENENVSGKKGRSENVKQGLGIRRENLDGSGSVSAEKKRRKGKERENSVTESFSVSGSEKEMIVLFGHVHSPSGSHLLAGKELKTMLRKPPVPILDPILPQRHVHLVLGLQIVYRLQRLHLLLLFLPRQLYHFQSALRLLGAWDLLRRLSQQPTLGGGKDFIRLPGILLQCRRALLQ